jgi:hypothetical protein
MQGFRKVERRIGCTAKHARDAKLFEVRFANFVGLAV